MDIGLLLTVFLGAVGIWLVKREMRVRTNALGEEARHRQALLKNRLKIEEAALELQRKRQDEERKDREEQRALIRHRSESISRHAEDLGAEIANHLKRDAGWAAAAMTSAKIVQSGHTIFTDRLGHYNQEKKHLAALFVPYLVERCAWLSSQAKQVTILVDSGTTLFPLLRRLGDAAVKAAFSKEQWITTTRVVSNNLPGIQAFMETGRVNPADRFSSLVLACELLPGEPLPIYAAVTGDKTLDAIRATVGKPGQHVIALTTGNWIRLRRTLPACAVPLAREAAHLDVKRILMEVADEIYVVAPLGKILVDVGPGEINKELLLKANATNPSLRPYAEVDNVVGRVAERTGLVTTGRRAGRILFRQSERVAERLAIGPHKHAEIMRNISEGLPLPNLAFAFDDLPQNRAKEIEVEFPHDRTRRADFMRKFFFVADP